MDHLDPTLARFHRLVGEFRLRASQFMGFVRDGDVTVATGPIGTPEPGVGQADERAEDHDSKGQYGGDFDQITVHA